MSKFMQQTKTELDCYVNVKQKLDKMSKMQK